MAFRAPVTALLVLVSAGALACTRAAPPAPVTQVTSPALLPSSDGSDLLGTTPPEWEATHWLNSRPLTLAELRGKVVLARWWTAGCPYCEVTAPALREFDREYGGRGLQVIGFYHHKEDGPLDYAVVDRTATKYGFTFPVAVDPDWHTLIRWWDPEHKNRSFTSVSFLIDKHGTIRHVHPGGEYAKGEPAYDAMKGAIEKLLAE
jgi:peroxiredoxin